MGNMGKGIAEKFTYAITKSALYTEKKLIAIGVLGAIAFPLYYFIWGTIFPQPYENLPLRILGSLLFLPLILIPYWPKRLRKHLPLYWFITFVYTLPFFFTFMLLMNDASGIWGMSTMAAILLMFLIIEDWVLINAMYFVGSLLAWIAYGFAVNSWHVPPAYLEQLPIYGFALVTGSITIHKSELVRRERLAVMASMGSSLAHELRTPLQGIRSGVNGLKKYLPTLIHGYQKAYEHNLDVPKIRQSHYRAINELTDRIENETAFSNSIIDMLLVNSGTLSLAKTKIGKCDAEKCIKEAINRYPFHSEREKSKIKINLENNFSFQGSELLFTHVIFNLIKNSLWAIHRAGKGEISISTKAGNKYNSVIFRDSGCGIEPSVLPNIFNQFYSTMELGKGAGIGLSFCKHVIESWGGKIEVHSSPGEYTEFVLHFTKD